MLRALHIVFLALLSAILVLCESSIPNAPSPRSTTTGGGGSVASVLPLENFWGDKNPWSIMTDITKPAAVNLGAVMDAVNSVHIDWLRDNRVEFWTYTPDATFLVNKRDDIGTVVNISIPKSDWRSGVYSSRAFYADVMAMALSKVGWPAYPDNLQSIPIPDAIQAVTGFECAEKYNRPKHSDLKVQEIAKWLHDHKWSRGKTDSITIPVIFQTLKEGTTTLKPNYAYAVRSFFPPTSIMLFDPAEVSVQVGAEPVRMQLEEIGADIDYIFTVKDEAAFAKYLEKKW